MVCNLCLVDKPFNCFSPYPRNKSGYRYRCKECTNSSYETMYSDKRKARYQADRENICEMEREKYKKSPALNLWKSAKARAKKAGIPFDISVEDIVIPEECPILKVSFQIGEGSVHPYSPTLDKIIPSLGYVRDNLDVISCRANRMKSDASFEELSLFCSWASEFLDKHSSP